MSEQGSGTTKVLVKDALYVPMRFVSKKTIAKLPARYEKAFYKKEKVCEQCDYFTERPSDLCESCANFGGVVKMHRTVNRNGKDFLRLPFGDVEGVRKLFGGDITLVNKMERIPMRKPMKFTGELRDYQTIA